MTNPMLPNIKKFPAAKQRRLDELPVGQRHFSRSSVSPRPRIAGLCPAPSLGETRLHELQQMMAIPGRMLKSGVVGLGDRRIFVGRTGLFVVYSFWLEYSYDYTK